jgi:hypothetical protein
MSDSPSFNRVIDRIYIYFKELMMAEYLQETLDQFDDFTPLEQYHIGVDLHRNDGVPTVSNGYARLVLEGLTSRTSPTLVDAQR